MSTVCKSVERNEKATSYKRATAILALLLSAGCSHDHTPVFTTEKYCPDNQPRSDSKFPIKLSATYLPNVVQIHTHVISGGLPEGEAAFRELTALGVKTVISVDGATPDAKTARKYGLRYVHLPHGYDGISEQRVKELAKAVRDLDGPIYIHCHHGKHRSPAAASVACVAAGLIAPTDARAVLELAGTSPNYCGLYQSADRARRLTDALLDEFAVEYPETAEVRPMAEAMVNIEHTHDHIQEIANAGWRSPESHPDIEPAHEAMLLREHFTELLRTEEAQQWPDAILQILRSSEADTRELETQLRRWIPSDKHDAPPTIFRDIADRIIVNCKNCHRQFRDIPLTEKY